MVEQNIKPQKGKQPRQVAVEMLNNAYDSLPPEGRDMSRDEFINESLDIMGKTKAQPKSKLILPDGV
jgi:hypothetical protein